MVVAGTTFGTRFGVYKGTGGNIIVALILLGVAYRGVRATFVYHALLHSQLVWKHVAIVTGGAVLASLITVIGFTFAMLSREAQGIPFTDEEIGNYLTFLLFVVLTVVFVILPRYFPLVRNTGIGGRREISGVDSSAAIPD